MEDTFRKNYTTLTEKQKTEMLAVKTKAEELLVVMNAAIPAEERSERSRCMATGRTYLETAIMWAVKGITTKIPE